jgi:hypothetical protein
MKCAGSYNRSHNVQDSPYIPTGGIWLECSGHGVCKTQREAAEQQNDYNLFQPVSYSLWDADKIQGCICDQGWTGYDCSLQQCPSGDNPFTFGVNEVQTIQCLCQNMDDCSGSFSLSFKDSPLSIIPATTTASELEVLLSQIETLKGVEVGYYFNDDHDSDSDGIIVEVDNSNTHLCNDVDIFARIEFMNVHGDLPLMRLETASVSVDQSAYNISIGRYISSTKENVECNNHGSCDSTTGDCDCDILFQSSNGAGGLATFDGGQSSLNHGTTGDCGYTDTSGLGITDFTTEYSCPSANDATCSGHGRCNEITMTCICNAQYGGHNCNKLFCPMGAAWFDEATVSNVAHAPAECSNRGICDRTSGTCMCQNGFSGSACDRLTCPVDDSGRVCSGNGLCLSMQNFGSFRRNDEGILDPVEYGSFHDTVKHFVHAEAWDARHIYGCSCERQYNSMSSTNEVIPQGFDCSRKKCRSGSILETINENLEVQSLSCSLPASAEFQLSFRESKTSWIAASAAASTVLASLESLPTVGLVSVNGTGCNIDVTFITELQNIPKLSHAIRGTDLDGDGLQDEDIQVSIQSYGHRIAKECSDNGLCDENTGLCSCFEGFDSSDGNGNPGGQDDCGYGLP